MLTPEEWNELLNVIQTVLLAFIATLHARNGVPNSGNVDNAKGTPDDGSVHPHA